MSKRLTTEEFIERARAVHGDKYDYSKTVYKKCNEKVCIICPTHGEFWQKPIDHLSKCGCPQCGNEGVHNIQRKTTERFIKEAKEIHGDKYDYSKVEYVNNQTKVCIICPIHGEFWQTAKSHLNGSGCPKCRYVKLRESKTKDTFTFINEAKKVHGDKYDYSKVEYKGTHIKVCIICPKHGEFWQDPDAHLHNQGCPKCWEERRGKNNFSTTEEFIQKAKKIHGDKYDYSKVKYEHSKKAVCIICPIHGEFWQTPNMHLKKNGCPKCAIIKNANKKKLTTQKFIEKAKKVHGDKYNYSKVEYKSIHLKVCITCPKHGEFWQDPNNHLNGAGCPKCKESRYEQNIMNFLLAENIPFEHRKHFNWLGQQHLDFYLPEHNIAIECQGEQHFEPIDFASKGKEWAKNELIKNKFRDKLKIEKTKENRIKLLHYVEIPKYFGTYENEVHNTEELKRVLLF